MKKKILYERDKNKIITDTISMMRVYWCKVYTSGLNVYTV